MKAALIYEKFISRGGLENYLFSLARELVKNIDLVVLTGETDDSTERFAVEHGVTIERVSRRDLRTFALAAERWVEQVDGLDVTVGFGRTVRHDLHRAGGGCHRYFSDHILSPLRRLRAKNKVELALERELYTSGKTRRFVVNSRMVADQLREAYRVPAERIDVIQTAVDSDRFRPASSDDGRVALREELAGERLPEGRSIFLFVSMNHRRKGLDALLRAWRSTPAHTELWIAGPALTGRHRRLAASAQLRKRVRQFVSPDDLASLYRAADAFIHPTLYDACANTVLQAMASALPPIVSAWDGACGEFIDDGVTGLRLERPDSPAQIVAAVRRLVAMEADERAEMAQAARERVSPLTWERHVDCWMESIRRVDRGG